MKQAVEQLSGSANNCFSLWLINNNRRAGVIILFFTTIIINLLLVIYCTYKVFIHYLTKTFADVISTHCKEKKLTINKHE